MVTGAAPKVPPYEFIAVVVALVAVLALLPRRFWHRHPTPAEAPAAGPEIVEPPAEKHVRTPSDVLRLLVGVVVITLGLLLATGASNTLVGFERDVIGAYYALPEAIGRILNDIFQDVAAVIIPAGIILLVLLRRKYRLFLMIVAALVLAQWVLSVFETAVITRVGPPALLAAIQRPAWVASAPAIDSYFIASLVAIIVVGAPWVSRAWQRTGWATVAVALVFRAATGPHLATDVVLSVGVGVVVGSAVLLAFGAPNRRPRGPAVGRAMARAGIPVARLERAGVDARSSTPYFGVGEDGRAFFIKVLGRDERSADLMFRLYRFLRFKDIGDRGLFPSLQRQVEHEAFAALYTNDGGVLTPRLVVTANIGEEGFLLAYERTAGDSLDRVADDQLTDDVLQRIWQNVAIMRARRVAHRDLRLANVMLAADGRPWLIDFGFAEIAATDQMLDADAAELLSSTALKVGRQRAVDAAVAVVGKPAVASAAPRIQPLALSTATRKSLVARKPLCDDLRKYAAQASDAGDVEPAALQRIKPRTILTFVALGLAFYLLIPQVASVSHVWSKLTNADLTWVLWAIVASVLTYLGATFGLMGAVADHIPIVGTFGAQLAGSFVNRITPARLGGIATNVRYLGKQGVNMVAASSGVGLQQLGGLITHLSLTTIFLVWAGRSGLGATHFLPSGQTVLVGLTVILALSGLLFLLPPGRKLLRKRVFPIIGRSGHGITDVVRRPLKLLELFGGSALLTLSYIAALVFSVHAFGGGSVSIANIGIVFLVGSAVSSVAPTPGGIGAVEAALIAGLTAVGVNREIAVPAVFLFRIATFWLPIVPGWIMFVVLQRRGDL